MRPSRTAMIPFRSSCPSVRPRTGLLSWPGAVGSRSVGRVHLAVGALLGCPGLSLRETLLARLAAVVEAAVGQRLRRRL